MTDNILLQLDVDAQPSTFDGVVAVDAGADQLFRHGGISVENVTGLVHGLMFTRGGDALKHSAIFIGGGDVVAAEAVLHQVQKTFFGPVRVSVLFDANGCNTTAAAAVVTAMEQVDLAASRALVLGGTGPVGRRAAAMLLAKGAAVSLASRQLSRAREACEQIMGDDEEVRSRLKPVADESLEAAMDTAEVVIACGAAGVELLGQNELERMSNLKVAIDLNAVPPAGVAGIGPMDKAVSLPHGVGYGAIAVGGLKMKVHKATIRRLFEANDAVLDVAEVFEIAESLSTA
ncbi:MAG: NAD(P)-dependent methylenetetrahydromethanopterin dehydrogenase [Planctomycetota bacterium]